MLVLRYLLGFLVCLSSPSFLSSSFSSFFLLLLLLLLLLYSLLVFLSSASGVQYFILGVTSLNPLSPVLFRNCMIELTSSDVGI
jgi:hypothetical protein